MSKREHLTAVWLTSACALASTLVMACGSSTGAPGDGPNVDIGSSMPSVPGQGSGGIVRADGGVASFDEDAIPFRRGGRRSSDASADGAKEAGDAGTDSPGMGQSDAGTASEGGAHFEGGTSSLAVHVSGNRLVDASNTPIVLRGADVSGTEFVCAQNYTTDPYGGSPLASAATFEAMRAWNINVIRLPLNEDCWLDINGVEVGGAPYQSAIEAEVSAAHAAGLYVIIDLHWTAPGTQRALSQNPEPDADHSPAFWSSVASTFASDPGIIFDLFNEPYDYWGTDPDPWNGWLNGDVQTQYTTGGSPYQITAQWKTAGMQQLMTAVRAAGATQPVLVNGLDWANDDSGWLTHVPADPVGQIVAGAHIYPGESCDTVSCW
ncbi:MAG TPA: cellulase family glycosylhydrolase, partial [Polyangiaceae bacterium]|nr:cellulase family glycosylhydrolase [Polyangiaceae bacterium]